jgi:cytochrome c551
MGVITVKRIVLIFILSIAILATASGCQKASKKPYSQSQKPNIQTPANKPATTKQPTAIRGAEIYKSKCLSCHGMSGQGGSKGPAINTTEYKDPKKVMAVVRNGKGSMPSFKGRLTDAQITVVTNYVATFIKK